MKKQHLIKIFTFIFSFIILFSFSLVVYAACSTTAAHSSSKYDLTKGLVQCGGNGQPCCDFKEAFLLINRILNWFITISISVATITFAYAGAQILIHPDQPAKREEAKGMFMKTIIGMAIILCAWLIVHTVVSNVINPKTDALRFLE